MAYVVFIGFTNAEYRIDSLDLIGNCVLLMSYVFVSSMRNTVSLL